MDLTTQYLLLYEDFFFPLTAYAIYGVIGVGVLLYVKKYGKI